MKGWRGSILIRHYTHCIWDTMIRGERTDRGYTFAIIDETILDNPQPFYIRCAMHLNSAQNSFGSLLVHLSLSRAPWRLRMFPLNECAIEISVRQFSSSFFFFGASAHQHNTTDLSNVLFCTARSRYFCLHAHARCRSGPVQPDSGFLRRRLSRLSFLWQFLLFDTNPPFDHASFSSRINTTDTIQLTLL